MRSGCVCVSVAKRQVQRGEMKSWACVLVCAQRCLLVKKRQRTFPLTKQAAARTRAARHRMNTKQKKPTCGCRRCRSKHKPPLSSLSTRPEIPKEGRLALVCVCVMMIKHRPLRVSKLVSSRPSRTQHAHMKHRVCKRGGQVRGPSKRKQARAHRLPAAAGSQRLFSNSAAGKKRGETLEPLSSLFFGGAYVGGHDESSTAWAQKNSPLSFFVSLCERACVCVCARA